MNREQRRRQRKKNPKASVRGRRPVWLNFEHGGGIVLYGPPAGEMVPYGIAIGERVAMGTLQAYSGPGPSEVGMPAYGKALMASHPLVLMVRAHMDQIYVLAEGAKFFEPVEDDHPALQGSAGAAVIVGKARLHWPEWDEAMTQADMPRILNITAIGGEA